MNSSFMFWLFPRKQKSQLVKRKLIFDDYLLVARNGHSQLHFQHNKYVQGDFVGGFNIHDYIREHMWSVNICHCVYA